MYSSLVKYWTFNLLVGGSNSSLPVFLNKICHDMLNLIIYCFKNWSNLSETFIRNSLYRKYRRIYFRFSVFDPLDKLFLCLLFCNSLIGLYSFLVLTNPSLRLGEIFILLPCIDVYLYFVNKKLIGTVYYHYVWFIFMALMFIFNSSTFILDLLYYEGLLLQDDNNQELSFLGKYFIDSISFLFKVLE